MVAEAPPTPEHDLVVLLRLALDPTPVHWGFAPFEASGEPPSLPMVVVQRQSYATAGYEDMCTSSAYFGDTQLALHVWAQGYEQARTLSTQARNAMAGAEGWRLQQELDTFDPTFRAWCIAGQWLAAGVPPD